jgi:radical SAM superfamily enzyme YgiQ (UPF0313 family)
MRYEGSIYRPPSEAHSLLIQATIGCAHNKCTFCSMFRDKQFRVRPLSDVLEDLQTARKTYRAVDKIFLCDGDALCLSTATLLTLMERIRELFPECQRVSVYGSPQDVIRKTPEDLKALRDAGLEMIYIGAESGNPVVLQRICKGATREEIILAVQKIEEAGIMASVTFISGMGGQDLWQQHAIDTGSMISQMEPSYVGLLTLMTEPQAPLYTDIREGHFQLLSGEEVLAETLLMLENITVTKTCVFRSNHASNYLSLKGNLPQDKEKMMAQLRAAIKNTGMLKDERFRML